MSFVNLLCVLSHLLFSFFGNNFCQRYKGFFRCHNFFLMPERQLFDDLLNFSQGLNALINYFAIVRDWDKTPADVQAAIQQNALEYIFSGPMSIALTTWSAATYCSA